MKIYTKTGDKGKTSVIGGRVSKDDIRVSAYGTLDETNSFIGKAISELKQYHGLFNDVINDLTRIQHELFDCGRELSDITNRPRKYELSEDMILLLEAQIDSYTKELPELTKFILPGGVDASATLHIARTVARRAEREIVTLMIENEDENPIPLKYMNRLSDFLFVVARLVNCRLGVSDVEYERSGKVFR